MGVHNHHGWWWIGASTARMTARLGPQLSEPTGTAVNCAPRRHPDHGAGQPIRVGRRARRCSVNAVDAGDPRLQQSAMRAREFTGGHRSASCGAWSAGRQHVEDGARWARGGARRAEAVALREAVREVWDGEAVVAALLGAEEPALS